MATATVPGADAPTDDATECPPGIGRTLHELTQGLLGLQNLLQTLEGENLESAALGMVDGASAIVARLGVIADRQQAVVHGFRTQSDAEWLGLAQPEGEAA